MSMCDYQIILLILNKISFLEIVHKQIEIKINN